MYTGNEMLLSDNTPEAIMVKPGRLNEYQQFGNSKILKILWKMATISSVNSFYLL